MRLLHVIPSMNPRCGGPMEGVLQMAYVHRARGISVEVVCFDDPSASYLKDMPLTVHGIGAGYFHYGFNPRLRHWLEENVDRFDAVIINGIWQYHAFGAWQVLRKYKVPYFVYTHGMLDPWFKSAYPFKHFKKWLYWPWADYRVLRDANAVLFTCEEEMLLAPKSFSLYKVNPRVVKYGAATPPDDSPLLRESFLSRYPVLRGKRIFLFLSRIHEKKGCDILIEAFSRVASLDASIVLVMAGPGSKKILSYLERLADKFGISERIIWTGMLQGDLKWGAFYVSELFVLPSHQENFGIAVAEALGCGLPVAISNKVNIWREVIGDGAGLVGNDDVDGTEGCLRRWIGASEDERLHMARTAKESFVNRFTVKQMAYSLVDTIKEVGGLASIN